MCVILHAKNKKHITRDDIGQSMKANSSGFYMAAINGTRRDSIRTLKEEDIFKFFDEKVKDDDEIVLHARIPSYGVTNLDNVHGWEIDGIQFCHNMSIRSIDGFRDQFPEWKDKTDSEFFFAKMFIPYYRGLGAEAYKDGKLHPDLDKFVRWVCGAINKFCFIMPDNKVLRFGTWNTEETRKEGTEYAFWASNSSYKKFTPTWPEYPGAAAWKTKYPTPPPKAGGAPTGASFPDFTGCHVDDSVLYPDDAPDTDYLRKLLSDKEIAKSAITDFVLHNVVEEMEFSEAKVIVDKLEWLQPDHWSSYDIVADLERSLSSPQKVFKPDEVLGEYIANLDLYHTLNTTDESLRKEFELIRTEQAACARFLNVVFDFTRDLKSLATGYIIGTDKDGKPMVQYMHEDVLIPKKSRAALGVLLALIKKGGKA